MAHWDVSGEIRGEHGRWAKGGSPVHRMVREVTGASGTRGVGDIDKEHYTGVMSRIQMGKGRTIKGVMVGRSSKGYYVGFPRAGRGRDSRNYSTAEHAGQALAEGRHHDEGKESAFRKAVRSHEPAGRPPREVQKSPTPFVKADTGYTPGKGVGGRYRGAGPESKYRNMSDAELRNYEISHGSEAARQERLRRESAAAAPPSSGLSGMSDRTLQLMVQRRGYNWKGAERELQARRSAQEAKLAAGRPAPGSMESKIASVEATFREEGISYTPQDLVATRLDSVLADLKSGDSHITIKVPSGSEISMPRDVAQELANRARKSQQSYLRGRYR